MYYLDKEVGLYCKSQNVLFFFGNKHLQKNDLSVIFPQLQFFEVKQVHGNTVIPVTSEPKEADGHWTDECGQALLIKSADCLPLLLQQEERIIALHSGWRGTLANILSVGLDLLNPGKKLTLACGPHIQPASFEVDESVAADFAKAHPGASGFEVSLDSTSSRRPGKTFLNLQKVVQWQLQTAAFKAPTCFWSQVDTFTDTNYHSYRRFKKSESQQKFDGRNYSFVARLPH